MSASFVDHPFYGPSTSIDPALKDTIRARVLALAEGEPNVGTRAAAAHVAWRIDARERLRCLAALRAGEPPVAARCEDHASDIARAWEETADSIP
ncbi:MAG TPA: hypothetical protein VFQ39_07580, partial [Longimicrobium sp.]|nr:hypothetical protein [Longimicrobium sp.]